MMPCSGIGSGSGAPSAYQASVQADCSCRVGLPVRLRVFEVNPARRFYERLGFRVVGQTDTHTLMEWTAPA